LGETAEAWEAGLGVRVRFSASSLALISECGTCINRRAKSVKVAESPVTFLAEDMG
jgi:hypothetical protein